MMAVQVFNTAKASLPDLEAQIARGEFKPLKEWMNARLHKWGSLYPSMDELLQVVCPGSKGLEPEQFVTYLTKKYTALYKL